ncbi:hypothetical protein [Actinomadura darangshiensis]|uniref:hypothetical protein n=1 Tax=Actinomadura darangshiensis TaxID=705336 RepID=UPI0010439777|nr:hypothetical protein [Actinomadura darangshiensis]
MHPLAEWLVKHAALRLPATVREDCCREWLAEIPAILEDDSVRFGWRRAIRVLWFAVDQWRGLSSLACTHQAKDTNEVECVSQFRPDDAVVFVRLEPGSGKTHAFLEAQVEAWMQKTGRTPPEVQITWLGTGRD